jgi:hypothetical protein
VPRDSSGNDAFEAASRADPCSEASAKEELVDYWPSKSRSALRLT